MHFERGRRQRHGPQAPGERAEMPRILPFSRKSRAHSALFQHAIKLQDFD